MRGSLKLKLCVKRMMRINLCFIRNEIDITANV